MACTPPFSPEQYDVLNWQGVILLAGKYLGEEVDDIATMSFDEALNYVYGRLIEIGEDPDEVLQEFDVTEEKE